MLDMHNEGPSVHHRRKLRLTRIFSRRRAEPPESLFVPETALSAPATSNDLPLVMARSSMSTTPSLAFSLRSRESLATTLDVSSSQSASVLLASERDPESRYYSMPSAGSSNQSEHRFNFERAIAHGPPSMHANDILKTPRSLAPPNGGDAAMMQHLQHLMTAGHSDSRLARATLAATACASTSPKLVQRTWEKRSSLSNAVTASETNLPTQTCGSALPSVRRVRTWTAGPDIRPPVAAAKDQARYARMPLPAVPQRAPLSTSSAAAALAREAARSAPVTPTRIKKSMEICRASTMEE